MNQVYSTSIQSSPQALETAAAVTGKLGSRVVRTGALTAAGILIFGAVAAVALLALLHNREVNPVPELFLDPQARAEVAAMNPAEFRKAMEQAICGLEADQNALQPDSVMMKALRQRAQGNLEQFFTSPELTELEDRALLLLAVLKFRMQDQGDQQRDAAPSQKEQLLEAFAVIRLKNERGVELSRCLAPDAPIPIPLPGDQGSRARLLAELIGKLPGLTHFRQLREFVDMVSENSLEDKLQHAIICHLLGEYQNITPETVQRVAKTLPDRWKDERGMRAYVIARHENLSIVNNRWSNKAQQIACVLLWQKEPQSVQLLGWNEIRDHLVRTIGTLTLDQRVEENFLLQRLFDRQLKMDDFSKPAELKSLRIVFGKRWPLFMGLDTQAHIKFAYAVKNGWIDEKTPLTPQVMSDLARSDRLDRMADNSNVKRLMLDYLRESGHEGTPDTIGDEALLRYWFKVDSDSDDPWKHLITEQHAQEFRKFLNEAPLECAWHACMRRKRLVIENVLEAALKADASADIFECLKGQWTDEEFYACMNQIVEHWELSKNLSEHTRKTINNMHT